MKKTVIVLLASVLLLQGCNTGVAFSLLGDLVSLRIDRSAAGEGHIEDVFKDAED